MASTPVRVQEARPLTAKAAAPASAELGEATLDVWFFWLKKETGTRRAHLGRLAGVDGSRQGRLHPRLDRRRAREALRLTFLREEALPCSETVIFDAFKKSARLPEGEQVAVELPPPSEPGEYLFSCQMGRLVVE